MLEVPIQAAIGSRVEVPQEAFLSLLKIGEDG